MKVCVIGGGASGMMASIMIAMKHHDVTLYEKNEKLGKKIYITGKGRCNVTNAVTGAEFLSNVVNNSRFIMSSEIRFNSNDTMSFFEQLGVPLKIERGNRVFPVSDKASDITKALEKQMVKLGVKIELNCSVEKILYADQTVKGVRLTDGEECLFDAVVVATGGVSYPLTGSTGDGYKFAHDTGHKLIKPVPGLVAIKLKDKDLCDLSGLSLKNVQLSAYNNEKHIYSSEIGEMLFTGNGISGPLALTVSSYINRFENKNLKLYIDFKPGLSDYALMQRIDRDIVALKAKQISSLLEGMLPKALVDVFLNRMGKNRNMKANQLTKADRESLCYLLKYFPLTFDGLDDIDRAIITSGGVSVKDIKPKSMESKLVKRLYFIGEVLDVDALTGGFNLQIAFCTAVSCASDF